MVASLDARIATGKRDGVFGVDFGIVDVVGVDFGAVDVFGVGICD